MSVTCSYTSHISKAVCSSALTTLENSLQQSLINLKDLVVEFELLFITSEKYKAQCTEQKERCQSNSCQSSEILKKVIDSKNEIIQLAASTVTKLNETKNFKVINDLFKILCGETPITSPAKVKKEPESMVYTPEKELLTATADLFVKEESLLEIEGTPGRISPIIPTRKVPVPTNSSSDLRDKKKCPNNWSTPESKAIKLTTFRSPAKSKTRLKQSRLNLIKVKSASTVDITGSPEFSGGCRVNRSENALCVQPLIKKESIEEDTILPSPTSGPTNFTNLYKTTCKNSPVKFKTPFARVEMDLKDSKCDVENKDNSVLDMEESIKLFQPNRYKTTCKNSPVKFKTPFARVEMDLKDSKCDVENKDNSVLDMEESIKLFQPNRHKSDLKSKSPKKSQIRDEDATHCESLCEGDDSISLLQHIKILETNKPENDEQLRSPTKRPLEENKNIANIQDDINIDSSMSLLSRELKPIKKSPTEDKNIRRVPESVQPIYKEPTVRKKAEKRALPGWSCDECKQFYDELYRDNPEMLAKKMDECSRHRGNSNPQRPRTPTGFWNPRWEVPDDTEEFNRRNNAV